MLFPIVNTLDEVLDALIEYKGAFINRPDIYDLGKQVYHDSERVFASGELAELDNKTMFPSKIASLADKERQVIQQYVMRLPAVKDPTLLTSISELIVYTKFEAIDLLKRAKERFQWSDSLYLDVSNRDEWSLNVARYPFIPGSQGDVLFPAHKDWGMFAIYPFVHGSGLEAYMGPATKWQWVEIPEGTVFCYAGDIFSRITNGEVPALLHRVSQPVNQTGSRTSIIFYVDPIRGMTLPTGEKIGDIIDSKLRKIGQIK